MNPSEAPNPYAPPVADVNASAGDVGPDGARLAARGARLGAAFLDGFLYSLTFIPAVVDGFASGVLTLTPGKQVSTFWWLGTAPLQLVTIIALALLAGLQATLVATTGQSIGKRVSRIRIVRLDGRPVGFVEAVLLRSWMFGLLGWVPRAGSFLGLADILFIFRRDRRCLHDLAAGTKVIETSRLTR